MSILSEIGNKLGRFSSFPANMMDRAFLEDPQTYLGKFWKGLKVRLIYTFLFVPMLIVDMVVSLAITLAYTLGILFRSDDVKDYCTKQQTKYSDLFSKSFLALIASPIGLFEPEAALFFVETTPELAAGKYYRAKGVTVEQPETQDALIQLMTDPKYANKKICVLGAGRSQGKQFLPGDKNDALVIDMSKFDNIDIFVHPVTREGTAKVGAGVIWKDVQRKANESKLALKVMQASNIFSVGGSIGCNIHGWDYHTGTLSNAIESIDVVLADGTLEKNVTPDTDLFKHVVGGFGMYGIVVGATLKLADNERLKRTSVLKDPNDYVDYFNTDLKDKKDARLHLYRLNLDSKNLLKTGFTETYVVDDTQPEAVKTPNFHVERERGQRFERFFVRLGKRYESFRSWYWKRERDAFQKEEPVLTTNEIMQAPINAMFNPSVSETEWLQEYFIPGDNLAVFLDKLGDLLMVNKVTLLNATVRYVKKHDENPLSPTYGGDRFAVVLCFNQSLQPEQVVHAQKWLRASQDLTVDHGGSVYLPYQHMLSPEDFDKSYPEASKIKAFKESVDPNTRFSSGFYEKYMNADAAQQVEVSHVNRIMDSDVNKKAFKGFLSNILKRVDGDKLYALLDDIRKYKDTQAEMYTELCRRLPEIMPAGLNDVSNKLSSLYAIKDDLKKQAKVLLPDDLEKINGIVEFGSPGRFVNGFREYYEVKGKVVAINDTDPSMMDCIDAGATHPYDEHIKLDYQALDLSGLEDNSADVVTCYVGLHHFTPKKLEEFLVQVRRILRPEAHFILVDHDVYNEDVNSMAHMAHFVFNAVNGVPLEDELAEIRDFKPMSEWIELLEKHGLHDTSGVTNVAMVREGDPTENQMMVFSPQPQQKHTAEPLVSSRRVSDSSIFHVVEVDHDNESGDNSLSL